MSYAHLLIMRTILVSSLIKKICHLHNLSQICCFKIMLLQYSWPIRYTIDQTSACTIAISLIHSKLTFVTLFYLEFDELASDDEVGKNTNLLSYWCVASSTVLGTTKRTQTLRILVVYHMRMNVDLVYLYMHILNALLGTVFHLVFPVYMVYYTL